MSELIQQPPQSSSASRARKSTRSAPKKKVGPLKRHMAYVALFSSLVTLVVSNSSETQLFWRLMCGSGTMLQASTTRLPISNNPDS